MTKIAIIGCGKQAPKHISGLRAANVNDILLVDKFEEPAKTLAEKEGLEWSIKLDAVLSNPEIKAVDICTPTQMHTPLILEAIRARKPFFCEKPMCENANEGRQISNLPGTDDYIGMVGYIYRFAPVFELAQKLVADDVLGKIVLANFRIGGRGSHQVWKHRRETGGGALNEMMVHMLDLAIWFFGPMRDAKVLTSKLLRPMRTIQGQREKVDAEDYLVVGARMQNAPEVLFEADMVTPAFSQFVEIQGENGSFAGSIQPDKPSYLYLNKAAGGYEVGRTELKFEGSNLFANQMGEFVSCLQEKRAPSRCTIEDSLLLLDAVENIREQVI